MLTYKPTQSVASTCSAPLRGIASLPTRAVASTKASHKEVGPVSWAAAVPLAIVLSLSGGAVEPVQAKESASSPLLERYNATQSGVKTPASAPGVAADAAEGGINPAIGGGLAAAAVAGFAAVSGAGKRGEKEPAVGTKTLRSKPAPPPKAAAPAKSASPTAKVSTKAVGASTKVTSKPGTKFVGGSSKVGSQVTGTKKVAPTKSSGPVPKSVQPGKGPAGQLLDKYVLEKERDPPVLVILAVLGVGVASALYALNTTVSSLTEKPSPAQNLTKEQELELAIELARKQAAKNGLQSATAPPVKEDNQAAEKAAAEKVASQKAAAEKAAAEKAAADKAAAEKKEAEASTLEEKKKAAEQAAEEEKAAAEKKAATDKAAADKAAAEKAAADKAAAEKAAAQKAAEQKASASSQAVANKSQPATPQALSSSAPADNPLSNPAVLGVGVAALVGLALVGSRGGDGEGGAEQQGQPQQGGSAPSAGGSDVLQNKKEAQEWIARWQAKQPKK